MTEFQNRINRQLFCLRTQYPLTAEERAVMSILVVTFQGGGKVTQRDIARSERWMGCHPKHEVDIVANRLETTTRQVRQIINDLRNKYQVPIVSDRDGYWICRSEQEAHEYLSRIELQIKATTKSHFETYQTMKRALNTTNAYLEKLEL